MSIFDQLKNVLMGVPSAPLPQNAVVIDVRSPAEFLSGHVDGAKNVPLDKLAQINQFAPSKDEPVIVYCASGMRSSNARSALLKMGYSQVFNAGGVAAAAYALDKPIV